MTTAPGAVAAMAVLGAAGCLPVLCLVGVRWFSIPLCPLAGAVVASLSATCCLAIGATTMTWFVVLSAVGAAASLAWWWRRPDRRPWAATDAGPGAPGHRTVALVAALSVFGAVAWCLHSLSSPTIGFDTRAIWLLRAGWLLEPHHRLVLDMREVGKVLPQASYPPLVSAAGSVAWFVTGDHSMRLGVVVIALLNSCALAAAALAVAEYGRQGAARLWQAAADGGTDGSAAAAVLPAVVGAVVAVCLVFVTFGVAEPFLTNGYADPMWSLAAVGATAYGLQAAGGRSTLGAAALLVVAAGMSKEEGEATALFLLVLLVARALRSAVTEGRRWWRPVLAGLAGLVLVGAWPAAVARLHIPPQPGGPRQGSYVTRARQAVDGLAPHLHVVLLAGALALAGWLVLIPVRRAIGLGHDLWAWAALLAGQAVIVSAYVTGTISVPFWLITTAHRVTEYAALAAWWLIAAWAVTAAAAPGYARWCWPERPAAVVQPAAAPDPEPAAAMQAFRS